MNVRALPAPWRLPDARVLWLILKVVGIGSLAFFWVWSMSRVPAEADAAAYWRTRDGLDYALPWLAERQGLPHPFVYSPALGQAIRPLTLLPYEAFYGVLLAVQLAAVAWMAGAPLAALLVWLAWQPDLYGGAIYPLMALALAVSARWPAAWAFLLLTKVTPGVGLLWYAVRREWRPMFTAAAATSAIMAVSFALDPAAWSGWLTLLIDSARTQAEVASAPLAIRLALAAVLIAYGALRGWRVVVPIGAMIAMPQLGWSATPMLLALIYWRRSPYRDDRIPGAHVPTGR